jgi:glycerol-3-phosphate acyltransferase PlsX
VLAVAQGLADAVVSAGDTGATVTSAALGSGAGPARGDPRWPPFCPRKPAGLVLLDAGSVGRPGRAHARRPMPPSARRTRR